MGEELSELVERCLAAESDAPRRDHDWNDADRAFAALFGALELSPVRPDFAARTVQAARRAPLPPGRRALVSRWARRAQISAATTTLLVGSAAALIVLAPLVVGALPVLVLLVVEAGLWAFELVKSGIDLWAWSADASRALAVVSKTSAGAAALTLTALVGFCAVMVLERLMRSRKESSPC